MKIEDPADWNEALAIFKEVLKIDPNPNRWERKRDEKIAEIVALIPNQPAPPVVPLHKFQELQAKLKGANEEISGLEEANQQLEKLVKEIKKAKDAGEVAQIELANLPAAKAFAKLLEKASSALEAFGGEVREAFYYHFKGEPLPPPRFGYSDTGDRLDEVRRAIENDYLFEDRDGLVGLNKDDPAVRRTIQALSELSDFIRNTPELAEPYEKKHGHQLQFTSRRFWDTNL